MKIEAGKQQGRQSDPTSWRSGEPLWHLDGRGPVTPLQLAEKLLGLEILKDLRYRGVHVEADAVDVTPCHETCGVKSYRFFVLRPVGWPTLSLPGGQRMPPEWRSEVLLVPREGDGLMGHLAPFEARFAVRSFLRCVEREIDSLLRTARVGPAADPAPDCLV